MDKICLIGERDILCIQPNTMKTKSQTIRIVFWVLLGVAILASNLALNRPLPLAQDTTVTPTAQVGTRNTAGEARGDVGSTDGIMIIAVVIVLIIIIPILLRRKAWSNGKGRK